MKILSIDIETTGLDFGVCQILSFGAVIENTTENTNINDLPHYYKRLTSNNYNGEIYALNLNKELLTEILENKDGLNIHIDNFVDDFKSWLYQYYTVDEKINVAGKNYSGFDKRFLELLDGWDTIKFSHKVIDPAMLYVNLTTDKDLPSLDECLKRAGLTDRVVTHNALQDAKDVIEVIRANWGGYRRTTIDIVSDDMEFYGSSGLGDRNSKWLVV